MTYTVKFVQDTARRGVGTVTATDAGTGVTHSRRVRVGVAEDVAAFVSEATARVAAVTADKNEHGAVEAAIAAELNK